MAEVKFINDNSDLQVTFDNCASMIMSLETAKEIYFFMQRYYRECDVYEQLKDISMSDDLMSAFATMIIADYEKGNCKLFDHVVENYCGLCGLDDRWIDMVNLSIEKTYRGYRDENCKV